MYRIPGEQKLHATPYNAYKGKTDLSGYIKHVDPQFLSNVAGRITLKEEKGQNVLKMTKELGRIRRPLLVLIVSHEKYKWRILDGRNRAGWAMALGFKTVPIIELELVKI